jgi:hypothetical protein
MIYKPMETHVECLVWDPFPTIDKCRYDGCTREAIIAACIEKYRGHRIKDMLIAVVIYDVSVIMVDNIRYSSEPLNMARWTAPK